MLPRPIFVFYPFDVVAANVLLGLLASLECLPANGADVGYLFLAHHNPLLRLVLGALGHHGLGEFIRDLSYILVRHSGE